MKRTALAVLALLAGCNKPAPGDEGLVKLLPQMKRSAPPPVELLPVPAAPEVPPTPRPAMRAMFVRRDDRPAVNDPWTTFAEGPKSAPDVETLKAWAQDEGEERAVRDAALGALHTETGDEMAAWWRAELPATKKGTHARTAVVQGLLTAAGTDAVPEAYALLGESEALDLALIDVAGAEAVPLLRAYQAKKGAATGVQIALTRELMTLDPGHEAEDADLLLELGDPETLEQVLGSERASVPALPKLLPRLGRGDLKDDDLKALRRLLTFSLHDHLEVGDAGAVALAQRWSKPDAATAKLFERVPGVPLVLGLWHVTRGELARADENFLRGLGPAKQAPREVNGGSESPEVAHAALLFHRACLLASTGRRVPARALTAEYEAWAASMETPLADLNEDLALGRSWCDQTLSAEWFAEHPLELSGQAKPQKNGTRLTVRFKNTTPSAVQVRACPVPGGGWVAASSVVADIASRHEVEAPRLNCAPVEKKLAAGAALTGVLDLKWGAARPAGRLRVSFDDGVELWFPAD